MKLKNRFKEIDKQRFWIDHAYCVICLSNRMCSLHHIFGTSSSSILNSSMLCMKHHRYADGHNVSDKKFQKKLLRITLKRSIIIKWQFSKIDLVFLQNEKDLIQEILHE